MDPVHIQGQCDGGFEYATGRAAIGWWIQVAHGIDASAGEPLWKNAAHCSALVKAANSLEAELIAAHQLTLGILFLARNRRNARLKFETSGILANDGS